MILAADYVRENKIPYFGLCLGMQIMTIAYARSKVGLKGANSFELDSKTIYPVIATMQDQIEKIKNKNYGGTMRLGSYPAILKEGTIAEKAYGSKKISERHRHRYEVNPEYIGQLEKAGLVFSGRSPDKVLMEIAELPQKIHPFYLGTQFHPEFKSRPLSPHPLFTAFIKASINNKKIKK
jgi:CTP synthase